MSFQIRKGFDPLTAGFGNFHRQIPEKPFKLPTEPEKKLAEKLDEIDWHGKGGGSGLMENLNRIDRGELSLDDINWTKKGTVTPTRSEKSPKKK